MAARDLILAEGDIFERGMFADTQFAADFYLYPEVWAKCVFPNRQPGTLRLANSLWSKFAACHYTTIIRCWNAWKAHERTIARCAGLVENFDSNSYLELHSHLFEFFCLTGSAIDNLQNTFAAPPLRRADAFKRDRPGVLQNLEWFYDRRTQFVHSAIVPCFESNGLPTFNLNIFQDSTTDWETPSNPTNVSDEIDRLWRVFVDQMKPAWSDLLGCIFEADVGPAPTLLLGTGLNMGVGYGSGSDTAPELGVAQRIPGSG